MIPYSPIIKFLFTCNLPKCLFFFGSRNLLWGRATFHAIEKSFTKCVLLALVPLGLSTSVSTAWMAVSMPSSDPTSQWRDHLTSEWIKKITSNVLHGASTSETCLDFQGFCSSGSVCPRCPWFPPPPCPLLLGLGWGQSHAHTERILWWFVRYISCWVKGHFIFVMITGGNLSSRINTNRLKGEVFSEGELKRLLRHISMVGVV